MFEKVVEIGYMFDFYGKLLSKKQRSAIELYYIHDLSLSEIGEQLKISRQGVYDTLKRAEKKLYNFEEKLRLVDKFKQKNAKVKSILNHLEVINKEIEKCNHLDLQKSVKEIEKIISDILESSQEVK
ncbi:MAG: YlxM family DNA-binding protein [Firmicutes bacterium]|nr:YlxM family DNA-binding protein [Bacillota bacterium]